MEYGKYGIAFSSGLSATNAIITALSSQDHIICIDDVYGGTQRLFRQIASPLSNLQFDFIDLYTMDLLTNTIQDKTKIIWIESPTNPTLKITDIQAIVHQVKVVLNRKDIWIVVDNTFMSPYLQNPLLLGTYV